MIDTFDPRTRRLVQQAHALGAPALAHLLADIDKGGSVILTLERYASLPLAVIYGLGGGHFPPRLHAINGANHQNGHGIRFAAGPRLRLMEGGRP